MLCLIRASLTEIDVFIYVTDKDNGRVQKFDSSGNFLPMWGSEQFDGGPAGLAVDSTGTYIYVGGWRHRVHKFSTGN